MSLPWTLVLPAAGFSFSVPVPEWMSPLSSGLPDEDELFELVTTLRILSCADLQPGNAKIKTAVTKSTLNANMNDLLFDGATGFTRFTRLSTNQKTYRELFFLI